ncbi:SDR family NAD(P)-dependent oxidoreductase [Streptomyces ferrugineus]|uniref:SDR family NAD(P)-dependent oxidoreductase n=1 Tax=Streptomyces ferrugineus TaxID=1413221 RepID=A0A7M2T077_9ACTN|nr:SDR family NAD(P)-dependent oxidoreductase [Streptomyces ferrugineus]
MAVWSPERLDVPSGRPRERWTGLRFEGQTVIVTGGSGGMGSSHVQGYHDEGANVVIAGRDDDAGGDLAAQLGHRALSVHLDVASEDDWAAAVREVERTAPPQVVIDAVTRLVVVVGRPLPGNSHDFRGWEESGAKAAVGTTTTIADGGYQGRYGEKTAADRLGTGLVIPHRRAAGQAELPCEVRWMALLTPVVYAAAQ